MMLSADEITMCAEAAGVPEDRVREVAGFARGRNQSLVRALVERGKVDESQLLRGLAKLLNLPFIEEDVQVPAEVRSQISPALAMRHSVLPLREVNGLLQVACSDPFDWRQWDDLCHVVGRPLQQVLCPRPLITKMLKSGYGVGADTIHRMLAGRTPAGGPGQGAKVNDLSTEEQAANEPTVVNLVNQILSDAIRAGATDIHFEAYEDRYRIRYRVDGMLEDVSMPASVNLLRLALVSRVKIMSNLDITEKRLPQDGRCQVSLGGNDYDLRVSILPGVYGEAVNIRLQSRQMVKLDLEALGFEPDDRDKIDRLIARPHGLVLVTGPTGSGKTTTLYTCLGKITTPAVKVVTIEDPVEYRTENILQMQVHEEIGFTFARALRSMLRHDPDIMLVGEIRDRETADIAIRSSLTGHLVFATLHTNDAASAFTRLTDIGIEPFLAASSTIGVIAQRLVRKVCRHCARPVPVEAATLAESRLLGDAANAPSHVVEGRRCEHCRFTGYLGRTVISEVLPASAQIRRLVQERRSSDTIKAAACEEGMRTLRESAMDAVRKHRTTVAEALRATQEDF
jgi:type II secretory ATPase GspE/PulE/Tfp pilus assembly ATPase PilB-like protein